MSEPTETPAIRSQASRYGCLIIVGVFIACALFTTFLSPKTGSSGTPSSSSNSSITSGSYSSRARSAGYSAGHALGAAHRRQGDTERMSYDQRTRIAQASASSNGFTGSDVSAFVSAFNEGYNAGFHGQ